MKAAISSKYKPEPETLYAIASRNPDPQFGADQLLNKEASSIDLSVCPLGTVTTHDRRKARMYLFKPDYYGPTFGSVVIVGVHQPGPPEGIVLKRNGVGDFYVASEYVTVY